METVVVALDGTESKYADALKAWGSMNLLNRGDLNVALVRNERGTWTFGAVPVVEGGE